MDNLLLLTEISFVGLSIVVVVLILLGINHGAKQDKALKGIVRLSVLFIVIWLALLGIVSSTGFTENFSLFPLNIAPIMGLPIITLIILLRSKKFMRIIENVPHQWLIWFQSFRIIVEVLLWMLFIQNLLPVHLTFEGKNWDILAGVFGLIIGFAWFFNIAKIKVIVFVFNILGLALLANIVVMAILTFPSPLQVFKTDPNNVIFMKFPYVFLPGVLVPAAYYFHFFSLKKLKQQNKSS